MPLTLQELISTLVCMGRAVVNIWLLRVGIMLLRVMRGVATPPRVSMERGQRG